MNNRKSTVQTFGLNSMKFPERGTLQQARSPNTNEDNEMEFRNNTEQD